MAQTTYEEYLANLRGPLTNMMAPQTQPQPQMSMPDISAIQQAVQGVQNVNQGYVAPERTDLAKFRTDFEEGRRGAAEDILAQAMGVAPSGMMSGGESMDTFGLTDAQKAYFDIETPAERDARIGSFAKTVTPGWLQAVLGIGAPVLSGLPNYNIRSEALKQEIANQVAAQQAASLPSVTSSGGGSFTVNDGSGGLTTYTGSGGYGGGGNLESTYGGGL